MISIRDLKSSNKVGKEFQKRLLEKGYFCIFCVKQKITKLTFHQTIYNNVVKNCILQFSPKWEYKGSSDDMLL